MKTRVGEDVGFRRTGATYLCRTERQLAEYEAWLPLAREYDIATRVISQTELPDFLEGVSKHFVGALHTATDGKAEPHLAAPAMAEAARRNGAHILTSCAVRDVETRAGKVGSVVTEHGEVACESVVLAGGSWSRLFAGNLGIPVPQLKVLGTAARIDVSNSAVPAMPVAGDNFAFRIRADGGYTIARRNANISPITPDSFRLFADFAPSLIKSWRELRLRIGKEFINEWRIPKQWKSGDITPFEQCRILDPEPASHLNKEAIKHLSNAFPTFEQSQISHEWAGLIDVTPDAVPIIDQVPQLPGFYLATGFSGHGFGLGPGAGELIADIVRGGETCVDPHPFRYARFDKGPRKRVQQEGGARNASSS
jgi:glycine/D-amino acid oxidase-like deaminating enzyme